MIRSGCIATDCLTMSTRLKLLMATIPTLIISNLLSEFCWLSKICN